MGAVTEYGLNGDVYRMTLGPAPGWSPWAPLPPAEPFHERRQNPANWVDYAMATKRPYFRFHERIATRQWYGTRRGLYRPGRFKTSRWQPYSGYGRFSGLRDILDGQYHSERYTGVRIRPEDYVRRAA